MALASPTTGSAEPPSWPAPPAACGVSFANCAFAELEPISLETFEALGRRDPEILRDAPRSAVLRVTAGRARAVLDAMIEVNWGSMEFFAHPVFAHDRRVLFFDRELLEILNQEYIVPATFPTRGVLREAVGDLPKGKDFVMDGFLIGNGRVVALYPHAIEVHRDDPPFDLFSANYSFYAVNIVDNLSDGDDLRLDHYRGRNDPTDAFGDIKAPLGCDLESLDLARGASKVHVDIHCWPWAPDWKIRNPQIRRRQ